MYRGACIACSMAAKRGFSGGNDGQISVPRPGRDRRRLVAGQSAGRRDQVRMSPKPARPFPPLLQLGSSRISHLAKRPDIDLARFAHGTRAALHPRDARVRALDNVIAFPEPEAGDQRARVAVKGREMTVRRGSSKPMRNRAPSQSVEPYAEKTTKTASLPRYRTRRAAPRRGARPTPSCPREHSIRLGLSPTTHGMIECAT